MILCIESPSGRFFVIRPLAKATRSEMKSVSCIVFEHDPENRIKPTYAIFSHHEVVR
jgi:hypothetical protein